MALKKVIEIDVDVLNAQGGIASLGKTFEDVEKNTKSLKAQLREAITEVQQMNEKFGETSKEAINAAKRAAELKDKIEDANDAVQAFKGEGTFLATSKALSSVASGFGAVQGAMGLIGVESEDVQEQLLKVQSAMALADGLAGLEDAGRSFKQLKAVAIDAFKGIKTAIGSTGIGLLVIALGTIYAYWDDIKEAVSGVSEEQKKLNADSQENVNLQNEKLKTIGAQDNILKLQGKSEKEILAIKIKQTDEAILATEINQKNQIQTNKLAVQGAQRNYELLKSYIDFVSTPLRFLYKTGAESINGIIDLLNKIPGINIKSKLDETLGDKAVDYLAKLGFDPDQVKADGEATIKESQEALTKLKNDRAGYRLAINEINLQEAKDSKAKAKEIADKEIELAKQKAEALERIRLGEINTEAERRAEEIREVQEQYRLLIEEANKYGQDTTALKEAQRTKEKELQDKFKAEDEQRELDYWAKEAEKSIARNEEAKKKREKVAAEEIEFEKNKDSVIAKSKENLNNIIQGLEASGLAKTKAGQVISKGIALTQIAIDSAVAISKASTLANAEGVAAQLAFPLVPGIGTVARVLSYASTGLSVVSNIARAKQLLSGSGASGSASSSSGSTGGAGGGGGAPSQAPTFNVVGNAGVNQIATTLGKEQPPVQAFVVSKQMTNQQEMDRNIVKNATL
jgi:hypothetical protein